MAADKGLTMQISFGSRYYILKMAGPFNIAVASGNREKFDKNKTSSWDFYKNRLGGDQYVATPIKAPLIDRVIEKKHVDRFIHIHPSKKYFEGVVIKGKSYHPDKFSVFGLSNLVKKKNDEFFMYGRNDDI